jgi:hypothetical protein
MLDAAHGCRNLHFVRYLPDRVSAVYRRTADASHAALTVVGVPGNVTDRAVEIAANLTVFVAPFGVRYVVDYSEIGRNRIVNLYPAGRRRSQAAKSP